MVRQTHCWTRLLQKENGWVPEQDFFTYIAMQLTRTLEKASTGQFGSFFEVFGCFFDLMGVQKIPPDFCVLGNPRLLELAELELAEPAIVTEPLELSAA